jgi:hypothetical protein
MTTRPGGLTDSKYTAPYTGAAPRYYRDKIGEYVSLADFAGFDPTGATTSTAAFLNAVATGLPVHLPAGNIWIDAQVGRSTSAQWAPALKVFGEGPENTVILTSLGAGATLYSGSNTANNFQVGGYLRDLSIKPKNAPAYAIGLELKANWFFRIINVRMFNLGEGLRITSTLGDPDACIETTVDNCIFDTMSYGINSNFSAGTTQPSFTKVTNSYFFSCSVAGWKHIGLQGFMSNCGFATCNGGGLWLPYNGSNNAQFTSLTCSFENCGPQSIKIESLVVGTFIETEVASTVMAATKGVDITPAGGAVCTNITFDATYVRIGTGYNPYTMFTLGAGANNCNITNTFWNSFDATGQVRYVNSGTCNRLSDSFGAVPVGVFFGTPQLVFVAGANNDYALPKDGQVFTATGPAAVFNITGFANPQDGRCLTLHNNSGQILTIKSENVGSTAANRIRTDNNADVTVNVNGTVEFKYIAYISRWVMTGKG